MRPDIEPQVGLKWLSGLHVKPADWGSTLCKELPVEASRKLLLLAPSSSFAFFRIFILQLWHPIPSLWRHCWSSLGSLWPMLAHLMWFPVSHLPQQSQSKLAAPSASSECSRTVSAPGSPHIPWGALLFYSAQVTTQLGPCSSFFILYSSSGLPSSVLHLVIRWMDPA